MTCYVALLRAVNVGGTGKLPMADLKAICADLGFASVATYIASGNVVFDSNAPAAQVKAALEARLLAYAGKPVGVIVRTGVALRSAFEASPHAGTNPTHTYVVFLDAPPPADAQQRASGRTDEEISLGTREIYIHYPSGMGRSKLKIPAAKLATARNMSTVAKLVEMISGR